MGIFSKLFKKKQNTSKNEVADIGKTPNDAKEDWEAFKHATLLEAIERNFTDTPPPEYEPDIISRFSLDIKFITYRRCSIEYSSDNPEQMDHTEDLYIPFSNDQLVITTRNIYDHIDELIKYYESLFRIHANHEKVLEPESNYLWIGLFIQSLDKEEVSFGFHMYHKFNELKRLFLDLKNEAEGILFVDKGVGTELTVANIDGKIVITEYDPDPDYTEIFTLMHLDRQDFLHQMENVLTDTETIIRKLTIHFGKDYWTDWQL